MVILLPSILLVRPPPHCATVCRLNLRSNYDGDIYLTILLNGFIHSIM